MFQSAKPLATMRDRIFVSPHEINNVRDKLAPCFGKRASPSSFPARVSPPLIPSSVKLIFKHSRARARVDAVRRVVFRIKPIITGAMVAQIISPHHDAYYISNPRAVLIMPHYESA